MLYVRKFGHKRGLLRKPPLDEQYLAAVTTSTPDTWSHSRGMLRGGARVAPLTPHPPGHRPAPGHHHHHHHLLPRSPGAAGAPRSAAGSAAPRGLRCVVRGAGSGGAPAPRCLRGRGRGAAGARRAGAGADPSGGAHKAGPRSEQPRAGWCRLRAGRGAEEAREGGTGILQAEAPFGSPGSAPASGRRASAAVPAKYLRIGFPPPRWLLSVWWWWSFFFFFS